MNPAEIEADLAHCTGTDGYTWFGLGKALATAGAIRMAELCKAYWLLDAIASHAKNGRRLCGDTGMQHWKLVVNETDRSAMLSVSDGDRPYLDVQKIKCTDFPLAKMRVWVGWQEIVDSDWRPVLMLPSEY